MQPFGASEDIDRPCFAWFAVVVAACQAAASITDSDVMHNGKTLAQMYLQHELSQQKYNYRERFQAKAFRQQ